jgi:hypothetical protein
VQVLLLARVLQLPVRQEQFLRLQVRLFQEQGLVREHQPEQPVRQVVLLLALAQGLQLLGPALLQEQVPELLLRVPVSQRWEQQLEQALELPVWQGRPLGQMQRMFPEGL